MRPLSTFTIAAALALATSHLPDRHYVTGRGHNARRITSKYPPDKCWKECKTEATAKASLARRSWSRA